MFLFILILFAMGLSIRNTAKFFRACMLRGFYEQAVYRLRIGGLENLAVFLNSNSLRWRLNGRPYFALMGYFACKKLERTAEADHWREIYLKRHGVGNCINNDVLNIDDAKELEKIIGQEFAKDTKTLYGRNVVVPYFANLLLSCVSFVVGLFLLAKLCGR